MSVRSMAVVLGVVVASLACGGAAMPDLDEVGGAEEGGAEVDTWDGKFTYECVGNQKKVLRGLTVTVLDKDVIGINAGGNCELLIEDCNITADFPLRAEGNAKVTVKGGKLSGRQQSIQAWGNGVVTVEGATLEGETGTAGNGKIIGP